MLSLEIITFSGYGLGSNTYLAVNEDDKEAVLIDAGVSASEVLDSLEKNDIELKAVLLTHGHPDHLLSLKDIVDATGAPCYMHETDVAIAKLIPPAFLQMMGLDKLELPDDFLSLEDGQELELAGMKFSRPLTHDLFTALLQGLGTELQRVLITKVVDNTYHAELILKRDGEMVSIDARPSDSIAIALRAKAPIYAHDDLLEQASIEIQSSDFEVADSPEEAESGEPQGMDADQLKEHLRNLNPEDFGRFTP